MLAFCSPTVTVVPSVPVPKPAPNGRLFKRPSFSTECGIVLAGLVGVLSAGRRQSKSSSLLARNQGAKNEELSHEDYDILLMKAGLRNLLGVEENRMARKLEEACQASKDLERCLSDQEVTHKVLQDEVEDLTMRLSAAQADNETLRAENSELAKQVITMKESGEKIKAKNSEQWAAQKAMENERNKAVLELKNVKDQAEAAQIKADSQVKNAKAELQFMRDEMKELKAELQRAKAGLHQEKPVKA
mmetsp:Transcript_8857/g.11035  ORF Transcript_8857/g.11035 Transcript_8857/m.11035 type:complete len:246 (+) Transcript_8857:51-788(+)|eukprot:CAMPEP_0114648782 /NCGR_PEP_ID=MMETSP0191-20121206/6625_1 /TAXON_ID=126664 /ORGANISM="Sorites sp." /LENGTH=245 /DNA_ID=CAMNT_0001862215 /DNA_START=149 /DNA_END=886 /DNA_ORIENTATION=-